MKKILFFAAAALAIGTLCITSCSTKSEGRDAANDESVVGATDGLEVDAESSQAIMGESAAMENTENNDVTVEEVTPETTPTVADKAKAAVEEGYAKTKEAVQKGAEKTKEAVKKGFEKTKEGVKDLL